MAAAKDLLKDIGDVYARSLRANMRILENGIELARRASARDADVKQLLKDGGDEMARALADYVQLSVDFAGRLIDLGLASSDAVLARASGRAWATAQPTTGRPTAASSVVHLNLSGRPGTTCSAGFTVENNKAFPVTIRFREAAFGRADGTGLEASLTFEPPSLTLQPAEKTEAFVHVGLPEEAEAGTYEAAVALEGLPNVSLRLRLTVEADEKPHDSSRAKTK